MLKRWLVRFSVLLVGFLMVGFLLVLMSTGGGASVRAAELGISTPSQFVWPISGNSVPDLPISSAYGPRLRAGCNYCYDYHQGIDIPTPVNTTLVAVTTGTVRIAGSHPAYNDGVVQLDHGGGIYSNYLHITASLVITGEVVGIGQAIALSGISDSGFPHLHFEIRSGSVWREDAVNPLGYLPYPDTITHTVTISDVLPEQAVWVRVTAPGNELDVNQITVTVRNLATNELVDHRIVDYEERNKRYEGAPSELDNPDMEGVFIDPHIFGSATALYVIDLRFHDLLGVGEVEVEACAIDIKGNAVCEATAGNFWMTVHLPMIMR